MELNYLIFTYSGFTMAAMFIGIYFNKPIFDLLRFDIFLCEGFDLCYCCLFYFIASKLTILTHEMRTLSLEKFKIKGEDEIINEILASQQEIINDFKTFNETYKLANLLFIVHHLGYLPLVLFREISMFEMTFAILGLNEVFLVCYSGQLISNKVKLNILPFIVSSILSLFFLQFEDLENAIWTCDWTGFSEKSKKKMLTMLTMTQNIRAMKAGPFVLSFETFTEILVNIYRILTAVKSFN